MTAVDVICKISEEASGREVKHPPATGTQSRDIVGLVLENMHYYSSEKILPTGTTTWSRTLTISKMQ